MSSRRLEPGQIVPARRLATLGAPQGLPDPRGLVHLQFRRFAGCPICDLHLQSIARRHAEIASAGIVEVAVFHSSAEDLRPFTRDLPFAVVADPHKTLYAEFGVESAPRALLNPGAWAAIVRGVWRSLGRTLREGLPLPNPQGGNLGLPADFLIDRDGRVLACRYGAHAYDQWSVDDILQEAAGADARPPQAAQA